jgi:hypothetical protein
MNKSENKIKVAKEEEEKTPKDSLRKRKKDKKLLNKSLLPQKKLNKSQRKSKGRAGEEGQDKDNNDK